MLKKKLPSKFSPAVNYLILIVLTQFAYIFSPNLRSSLLILFVSGLILWMWLRISLPKIFISLMAVTLPIEMGIRGWIITAALPQLLSSVSPGYYYFFGINTMHLLLFGSFFFVYPIIMKVWPKKEFLLLCGFAFFSVFSVFFSPHLQLSITGYYVIIISLMLYFVGFSGIIEKQVLISLVIVCFGIFGSIGSLQIILQEPVGLYFEPTNYSSWVHYTTDGVRQFRASGFSGHPTFFASLMSIFFPIALYELLQKKTILPKSLVVIAFILGTVGLFSSLSRSAFVAIALATIVFFLLQKPKLTSALKIVLLMPLIVASPLIITRLGSLVDYFGPDGNRVGRVKLVEQAISQIGQSPLFGVGPNHFVARMVEQEDLDPVLQNFLFPVHNTWLLFGAELGLPALISFVMFAYLVLRKSMPRRNDLHIGIWLGVITFLINSQYHTLFHQDASFGYFMFFLGVLSRRKDEQ